jgi:hypothetical protein
VSGAGEPSLLSKQLTGIACTIAALVTLAIVWHWRHVFAVAGPMSDDVQGRLAYVLTWLLLPGLALLIGVQAAARRGFYRDAIDGTRTPLNHALEINLRYNTNTVEQVILAAIAWTGLALYLPDNLLPVIPVLAVVFFVGRITFFIGYLIQPIARAYGMVLTAFPTLIAYAWLTWRLVGHSS